MSVAKVFRPTILMSNEPTISRRLCRNLFGPIDHEQLRSELQSELKRIDAEKQRRWNFDFAKFQPLSGDFLWQRMSEDQTTGLATIGSQTDSTGRQSSSETSISSTTVVEACSSNETTQSTNTAEMCLKTPERTPITPKRRSLRITDYLRGKKKSTTSRKIKFGKDTTADNRNSLKQVQTRRLIHRGRITKQPMIDEILPKIRQEMSRILQKDSFVEAENRVMAAFKGLLGKDGELRTTDIVNSVEMVAKRTGKRKPSSLIKFKDPSAKVENMFKDKVIQFWILCVGVPEDIQQVFVCGEDQAFIECPDTDLVKALVDVISCYYVFDVSYPDSLVGILTFLQEIALELYDSSHKGTKYATFMSELKSLINKK